MSSRGIQSRCVTSSAKIAFWQPHCPHQSELAPVGILSGFVADQNCWERLSGDTSGKRKKRKKEKKQQSYFTHELIFFWSYWTSEEKLQIVNLRSLPSRVPLSWPRLKCRQWGSCEGIIPFPSVMRKLWEDQTRTDDLSMHLSAKELGLLQHKTTTIIILAVQGAR